MVNKEPNCGVFNTRTFCSSISWLCFLAELWIKPVEVTNK